MKIIEGYETWSELDLLTGVIIGEARGESTAGMIGVGLTVKTRAENPKWWGRNWREVILRCKERSDGKLIFQFSCWQDLNANVIRECYRQRNALWKTVRAIALSVYSGDLTDTLGGPTHYHAATVFPDWASGMERLSAVGNHIFYRERKDWA